MAENVHAATQVGVTTLGLADHVRQGSSWFPEKRAQINEFNRREGIEILFGIEAKILNRVGQLDMPTNTVGVDYVLIADHRFPGEDAPLLPSQIHEELSKGKMLARDAIDQIITAMVNAVVGVKRMPHLPILAHPFSLLPKIGLTEELISDQQLDRLAEALLARGALLEVNEKWNCPAPHTISYLSRSGVPLMAGSDAHSAVDIGRFSDEQWLDRSVAHEPL